MYVTLGRAFFGETSILIGAVEHVIASLRESGRQHPLVIENNAAGKPVVGVIFSSTQIEK
ncbi:MAG: hypothetical protein H0Z53_00555 [Nitrosospira sp.]|nr:hypothetical protein [Nitrosospira sp.]